MHRETSLEEFKNLFNHFQLFLGSDDQFVEFSEYFRVHYSGKVQQWAYCHRTGVGLTCNNYIEAFHRTLKRNYLHGKKINRVDKCVDALLKFTRDYTFKRALYLAKDKYTHKEKDIMNRHRCAKQMKAAIKPLPGGRAWEVFSTTKKKSMYVVMLERDKCAEDCFIKCRECEICPHMYTCECADHLCSLVICKHIHYVAMKNKQQDAHIPTAEERQAKFQDVCLEINSGQMNRVPHDDERIIQRAGVLMGLAESPNLSLPSLNIEQVLRHINKGILLLQNAILPRSIVSKEPANKAAETQRRFFSTKKARKRTAPTYSNPTEEEKVKIKRVLSQNNHY